MVINNFPLPVIERSAPNRKIHQFRLHSTSGLRFTPIVSLHSDPGQLLNPGNIVLTHEFPADVFALRRNSKSSLIAAGKFVDTPVSRTSRHLISEPSLSRLACAGRRSPHRAVSTSNRSSSSLHH